MARIIFTLEDGTEIETELDSDVITVGRHQDSIVALPSASVSSQHATIKRRGESYYVQDLGSTNGTKLNGVEIEEAKLEDGDTVTFGDIPGMVHLTNAPAVPKAVMPTIPEATAIATPAGSPARRAVAARRASLPQHHESTGCAGFLIFLLLLMLAFIVGLHVRHGVETGGFMVGDVLSHLRERVSANVEEDAAPEHKAGGKKEK